MTDQHTTVSELLGAYALHAVDGEERELVGRHLDICAECRAELAEFEEVAGALGAFGGGPGSESWEHIRRLLEGPTEQRNRNVQWWSVAAAAILVVLAVGMVAQQNRIRALGAQLETAEGRLAELSPETEEELLDRAAFAALASDSARLISLAASGSQRQLTIVLSESGRGYMAGHNLPELPEERTYQLWAVVDQEVISVGVLGSRPGTASFRIDPEALSGFAVTEERAGGVAVSEAPALIAWSAGAS